MKKIFAIALTVFTFCYFSISANAETSDQVTLSTTRPGAIMTTAALNVRTGASTQYGILTTLPSGSMVMAVERCTNGWFKVQYDTSGHYGYVSGTYVDEIDLDYYCVVNSGSDPLRLREQPNLNSTVIKKVSTGKVLPELLYLNSDWDYVLYGNRDGYMSSPYLLRYHY